MFLHPPAPGVPVDARSRATRRRRRHPFPALLLLLLATVVAACSTPAASPSPTAVAARHGDARTVGRDADADRGPDADADPGAHLPADPHRRRGHRGHAPGGPRPRSCRSRPPRPRSLFALGVGDKVVGQGRGLHALPARGRRSVPDVAKFGSVDVEKIVGLGTDLVIAGGSNFNPPEAIAKLRQLGVPGLVVYAPDVKTALADIDADRQRRRPRRGGGQAQRPRSRSRSTRSPAATSGLPKPRVYYELDATNGFFGPAPDYFGTEMIKIAGGEPLTSGTDGRLPDRGGEDPRLRPGGDPARRCRVRRDAGAGRGATRLGRP